MGTRRFGPLLGLAGIFLLVLVQQLAQVPRWDLLGQAVNNSLHVPLFALIALLVAWVLPRPTPLRVLGVCAGLGILTELLQIPGARSASVFDVMMDLLGAGAVALGLGLRARTDRRTTRDVGIWAGVGIVVLLMTLISPVRVLAAYQSRDRSFPVVLDPGARLQAPLWSSNSEIRTRDRPHDSDFLSPRVFEVRWSHERYPALTVAEVVPDWSGYAFLEVEVWLSLGAPIPLTAAVGHRGIEGTAAYQRKLVNPGFQRLRYSLSVLLSGADERPAITKLMLHTDEEYGGRRALIGWARLTGDGSDVVVPGAGIGSR